MTLALITLLPAKLGGGWHTQMAAPLFPNTDRRDFCHQADCQGSLGEDLPSAQGQDAYKLTGKSLGLCLSREVWYIIL